MVLSIRIKPRRHPRPLILRTRNRRRQRAKKRPWLLRRAGKEKRMAMNKALGHEIPQKKEMVRRLRVLHHHHHCPKLKASSKNPCKSTNNEITEPKKRRESNKGSKYKRVLSRSGMPEETKAAPFRPCLTPGIAGFGEAAAVAREKLLAARAVALRTPALTPAPAPSLGTAAMIY